MKFSQIDVIGHERLILYSRKAVEGLGLWNRLVNTYHNPRNPKHTFTFYVPHYLYIRSVSFCDDISQEIGDEFTPSDLARILYIDFLEFFKKKNDLHDIHRRLSTGDLSPVEILPYKTDEAYQGVIFEETRGFEEVRTVLDHRASLKGEFLLRDMLEVYEHDFTLENILEIVYSGFVDDYRKGLIQRPINKIIQYV